MLSKDGRSFAKAGPVEEGEKERRKFQGDKRPADRGRNAARGTTGEYNDVQRKKEPARTNRETGRWMRCLSEKREVKKSEE